MDWISREVDARRPLSTAMIHSWAREALQVQRGSYELVQLCVETSRGRLTEETQLPIQENMLPLGGTTDQLVFVIRVTIPKQTLGGRGMLPTSHIRYYLLSCSKRMLLPLLDSTLCLSVQLVSSLQDMTIHNDHDNYSGGNDDDVVVLPSPPQHSLPYRYRETDNVPLQLDYAKVVELVKHRLKLCIALWNSNHHHHNPEEARRVVAIQAEEMFRDEEQDKLSLHLCCGLLAALADVRLSKAKEFSECEALLYQERCQLRGIQWDENEVERHRKAIMEDICESSHYFLSSPLSPDGDYWKAITEATAEWRQNTISLVGKVRG